MSEAVDNIMRLANLLAMKKVRRFACNQPNYRGLETEAALMKNIDALTAELRAAVEALASG